MREFGTSSDLATRNSRPKRFFFALFVGAFFVSSVVACYLRCGGSSGGISDPPSYSYCPPSEIQNKTKYYAPRGENAAVVVWTEPPSNGEGTTSSLSCCGVRTSGEQFQGSLDGTTYYMTYTVKDTHGRAASCEFSFTVFSLACTEPTPSPTRLTGVCTKGLLYGSECTFHCIEGYEIQDGISNTASCEMEKRGQLEWTSLPECKKKKCAPFPSPEYGIIECSSNTYEFGTTCSFSCIDGYGLVGTPSVFCQANGQWSSSADTVTCKDDEPPVISCSTHVFFTESGKPFALVYWAEPVVQDNVDFNIKARKLSDIEMGDSLQEGMHLIPYRATDLTGNSHPIVSECSVSIQVQIVKCITGPTDGLNDTRFLRYNCSASDYSSGTKCTLFCDLNLSLGGATTMTCEQDGKSEKGVWQWSEKEGEPHCIVIECPPLTPPANGAITYDSVNARPLHVMLCQSPFDSPVVGASFTGRLSCQDSGKWYPLDAFPDCIISMWSDIVLPAELIFEGSCQDEETKVHIKTQVIKYMNSIQEDIDMSICPGKDCIVDNIMVECGSRKRRATYNTRAQRITKRQDSSIRVSFDFSTPFDLSNASASNAHLELFLLLKSIAKRVADDVANGTLDISGFTLAADAFQSSNKSSIKCPPTYKKDGFKCKPCPKGTFMNSTTRNCEMCSIGKYNEADGKGECDLCPQDHSTLAEGSKYIENCTRLCNPGFVSGTTMIPCSACPLGSYQPNKGSSYCITCPVGHITSSTNSTSVIQCKLFDLKVNNLNGEQLVGNLRGIQSTSILSVSLWARRDIGSAGELSITLRDISTDILVIRLAEQVTLQSGNVSTPTAFSPSSKRWSHLLVVLDLISNKLTVFVDGVEDVKEDGLSSTSVQSGSMHLSSRNNTGIMISGLTIYPRNMSSAEIQAFGSICLINSTDAVFTMDDLVANIVDGLVVINPSTCDPYDECATSPCGNHICLNGIGTLTCLCSGGWSGTRCNVAPNYCLDNDCKHGKCVPGNGTYTCNCTGYYTGVDCSIPPVDGGWSSWSDWSACDVTCGGGNQTRQRHCVNPPPGEGGLDCIDAAQGMQYCNTEKCPECPRLLRGFNTDYTCERDTTNENKLCKVRCIVGTTFPEGQKPYPVYKCGRATGYTWVPFGKIPECSEYSATEMLEAQINAEYTQRSPSNTTAVIASKIQHSIKNVSCVVNETCNGTVSVGNSQVRSKRSTGTSIKVSFIFKLPELKNLDTAGYIQNGTVSPDLQTLKDAFTATGELYMYLMDNAPTLFKVTVDGVQYSVNPDTIDAFIGAYCNPGFTGSDGLCVECQRGTYQVDTVCRSCDVGTYQSSTGQTKCEPCPTGYTTATYMATSIEECSVFTASITPTQGYDENDFNIASKTAVIASSVSSVVVVTGAIIIGVIYYKRFRKQSRNAQSRSLASLNMVRPEVVGSIEKFTVPRGDEQANVCYKRDNSFGYNSPQLSH